MKRTAALLFPMLMLSASGCFTGVESTPKITANDVKREQVTETTEDRYMASVLPQRPAEWQPGKLFYVTDDKISLAIEPMAATAPRATEYLEFKCFRPVTSVTGTTDTEVVLTDERGNEVVYKLPDSPENVSQRNYVEIPFTIETSVVDKTRELLTGKSFYVRTAVWYDENGDTRHGLKFIPVTITEVTPGNMVYPVRLKFTVDGDKDDEAYLYMSVGETSRSSRTFANLFSIKDPHLRYPAITDETWSNIIHGRVAKFMTREECRLALGSPASIDRRPGISTMRELWFYENGVYLMFDDGLLQSFRR